MRHSHWDSATFKISKCSILASGASSVAGGDTNTSQVTRASQHHVSHVRRPLVTHQLALLNKFSVFASVGSPGPNSLSYETSRGGRTPGLEHACVTSHFDRSRSRANVAIRRPGDAIIKIYCFQKLNPIEVYVSCLLSLCVPFLLWIDIHTYI